MVFELDVLGKVAEQRNVVLAAEELAAVGRVLRDSLVDLLVIGELRLVLDQIRADLFIVDEGVHDIGNHGGVIRTGRSQQPRAAPEVCLRAFADRPVAEAALVCVLCVAHGEVEVPGRPEVAHGLALAEHLRGALIGPDIAVLRVAVVGEVLRLLHPGLDGRVDLEVVVRVDPRLGNIVGEDTVGSGLGGGHQIALGLGVSRDSIELVPAVQQLLDLGGIVGAQNVLGDGAAVNQSRRAALEGYALNDAGSIRRSLHGICIGAGEIGHAEGGDVLRDGRLGILLDVVGLSEEQVDLVVCRSVLLIEKSLVELVLIGAIGARGDDPVDGHAFGNGVVLLKEALELFVPGVDVEDLAFLGSGFRGGCLFGGGVFVGLGRLSRIRGSGGRVGRRFLAGAACKHSCEHQNCKKQRKILFHLNSSCKK